ncbi:MAG: LptF/LptG family permease [Arcobacteraceae bacterium]|nr:LptF/LptG family permease [Arcobacteraceae bacterium]
MKLITKYLLLKYLKYFFIILISLEIFFMGFDFLQYIDKLPKSANLQLLYLVYNGFFILTITLPLSILFAWIVTLTFLIKENTLISFYSLGISKKAVILPIVFLSIALTSILLFMQMTELAYSSEQKSKILNNNFFVNEKYNILLKYNNNFVYFQKLYPLEKKAENIKIFKIEEGQLVETIMAKTAYYEDNKWYVVDAKILSKPKKIEWESSKLELKYEKFLYTLDGFKPEIISNVYKANIEYSISDAVYTILLFDKQGLNTDKIRAILYGKLFVPFMVVPLLILFFAYSSISGRFFKAGQFISISILLALGLWGVFFFLQKLATANLILPEIALLLPLGLLLSYSFVMYQKRIA